MFTEREFRNIETHKMLLLSHFYFWLFILCSNTFYSPVKLCQNQEKLRVKSEDESAAIDARLSRLPSIYLFADIEKRCILINEFSSRPQMKCRCCYLLLWVFFLSTLLHHSQGIFITKVVFVFLLYF